MTVLENVDVETEKKVNQLKARFSINEMKSLQENDFTYYRFLKAQNFDLEQAEIMIRKHLEWKKKYEVDIIQTQEIVSKDLNQYLLQIKIGFDKENCPVRFIAVGDLDLKGIRKSVKFVDRMRYIIKMLEEDVSLLEEQSKKLGKKLDGNFYIFDMKNFSFANATDKGSIEDAINIIKIFQENYPERLKSALVINASSYFAIAFSLLKNFISATILDKIQICNSEEEWKRILLDSIDADILPEFLGGKRNNPNEYPNCDAYIKHKGIIPESFHMCKSVRSLSKEKDVKKLTIPRASFNEIKLGVKEAGSVIEWEFETKSRDIGFGLFLSETGEDGEEKITELVPLLRLDTEEFSETGMYKCEKAGTYVILFDNSYSWMRAKEIYYKANVVSFKDHEKEMSFS